MKLRMFYSALLWLAILPAYSKDLGIDLYATGCGLDKQFEKIVLPFSQDEINANPALGCQPNKGY